MQPYREKKNIESDVLVGKITGYWREMFEKNKTSNADKLLPASA